MRNDKADAKVFGIPSYLRKYAKRYGLDVGGIIQIHLQNKDKKPTNKSNDSPVAYLEGLGRHGRFKDKEANVQS